MCVKLPATNRNYTTDYCCDLSTIIAYFPCTVPIHYSPTLPKDSHSRQFYHCIRATANLTLFCLAYVPVCCNSRSQSICPRSASSALFTLLEVDQPDWAFARVLCPFADLLRHGELTADFLYINTVSDQDASSITNTSFRPDTRPRT